MTCNSNRRTFLKNSAVASVGTLILPQIIPSTALGMGGRLAPSNRLVMGAIGTGSQGRSNIRDFLKLNKEVQFVALCDVDTNNLQKVKELADGAYPNNGCRGYGDYREFLEKEKLDAVTIALPDHWHGIIYTAAVEKKLHVYGEKPICRTIRDGQTIVKAVQKNKITWQTGSWQRSRPNFHRAAELGSVAGTCTQSSLPWCKPLELALDPRIFWRTTHRLGRSPHRHRQLGRRIGTYRTR